MMTEKPRNVGTLAQAKTPKCRSIHISFSFIPPTSPYTDFSGFLRRIVTFNPTLRNVAGSKCFGSFSTGHHPAGVKPVRDRSS
jgi:hypothetical protein